MNPWLKAALAFLAAGNAIFAASSLGASGPDADAARPQKNPAWMASERQAPLAEPALRILPCMQVSHVSVARKDQAIALLGGPAKAMAFESASEPGASGAAAGYDVRFGPWMDKDIPALRASIAKWGPETVQACSESGRAAWERAK